MVSRFSLTPNSQHKTSFLSSWHPRRSPEAASRGAGQGQGGRKGKGREGKEREGKGGKGRGNRNQTSGTGGPGQVAQALSLTGRDAGKVRVG